MAEARWFCPWALLRLERALLPDRLLLLPERLLDERLPVDEPLLLPEELLPEDLPLPDDRLPPLLCLFWVVFFDFCPLLRRAVDACAMVC